MGKAIIGTFFLILIFFVGLLAINLYMMATGDFNEPQVDINVPAHFIVEPDIIYAEPEAYYERIEIPVEVEKEVIKEVQVVDTTYNKELTDAYILIENLKRRFCDVEPKNAICAI